jgi:hypothetical protein
LRLTLKINPWSRQGGTNIMTISKNVKAEILNEAEMLTSINQNLSSDMAKNFIEKLGGQLNKLAGYLQFEFYDGSILSVVETNENLAIVDETELAFKAKEVSNA